MRKYEIVAILSGFMLAGAALAQGANTPPIWAYPVLPPAPGSTAKPTTR